jgi:putative ABC transport system permease protein
MNLLFTIKTALMALNRNRLRSSLTMLGIIIGVSAFIIMVSVGQGAKASIESEIKSMGTNVMMVMAGNRSSGGMRQGFGSTQTLVPKDCEAILQECPAVLTGTPMLNTNAAVIYGNQNWSTSVSGVGPEFFTIRDWQTTSGNIFSDSDVRGANKVCVIGTEVAKNLFEGEDPIGKMIRIRKIPFKVVGLLASKGQTGNGQNQDDIIIVPYTTLMKRMLNRTYVQNLFLSAVAEDQMTEAKAQVTDLLRQRHKIKAGADDDFFIGTQSDITSMATSTSTILTLLLGSVASISLIVGGIGIMNIMLVSVRERTREIGVRMALGARGRDILTQFMVESFVLSALGGLMGILLGVGGTLLVSQIAKWPTYISVMSMVLSIGFSSAIGIFFGFYPARTAARLNPIDALRFE